MTPKELFKQFFESDAIKCTCETCSMEHTCAFSWDCCNQNGQCLDDDEMNSKKIDRLNKRRLYAIIEKLDWKKLFHESRYLDVYKRDGKIEADKYMKVIFRISRWETKLWELANKWGVTCRQNP